MPNDASIPYDSALAATTPGLPAPEILTLLLDGTEEAVVVIDAEMVIRGYNPAAERLFGYAHNVVLGKRFAVLDRPMTLEEGDDLPMACFPAMTALKTGRATDRMLIGLTDADHRVQWMRVRALPLCPAGATTPSHVAILYENVTARREAEMQAALHGQVINQAADAIAVIDSRGLVLEVNPSFTRLTGFASDHIVGGSLRIIEQREPGQSSFSHMMEALRRGEVWSNRIRHRRRDGAEVDCIGTLSPLYGPGGALNGFVYMLRDMSRIAEMERRMITSQKMEAIGTLAGGIAHDFNNLLHSISGYTELALREISGREEAYLRNVLGACERAEGLVRQILTFSRREERERRPVNVREELEKAANFVRVTLPASVKLSTDLDCGDLAVLGDATELHQVVINLLTNAYQALPDKSGDISIRAGMIDLTESNRGARSNLTFGPYVEIEVCDSGKGIPPAIIDRIFEPFFTTKPVNEGTGMGLSIVHGVITSMHGDISVRSRPGEGTCFTILLPVVPRRPDADESAPKRPARGHERVLLVDDEGGITAMVSEMLSGLGYQVVVRDSGESALELLRANPEAFDILITDQNMPNITGAKLAALANNLRPSLPVLLCTGNADKDLLEKAEAAGVAHILHKPLRLSAIAGIIRSTLDEWAARRRDRHGPPKEMA